MATTGSVKDVCLHTSGGVLQAAHTNSSLIESQRPTPEVQIASALWLTFMYNQFTVLLRQIKSRIPICRTLVPQL